MMSQDASESRTSSLCSRRKLVSTIVTSVVVMATFLTARWLLGPSHAEAQAPRTSPTTKANSPTTAPRSSLQTNRSAAAPAKTASAAKSPTVAAPAVQPTGIMAVVNGDQITRDQLAQACLDRFGQDVLEGIVNKHLIWQACQAQNITITDQDVQAEIGFTASRFGMPTDRYLQMLQEEREISADQYRREYIWPRLALRRLAATKIQVTEEELKEAFETEYGPSVKVRMIAVSSKEKAEQIHREVTAKPDSFADVAKAKSEDPNAAANRGQIPPIRKHVGVPEVEQAAFALAEGQISPVVFAANQYLILKCEKHVPESYVSSTQIPQIETRLRDQISENKLRSAAASLFSKLESEAKVVNVLNDPKLSKQMPGVAATINNGQVTIKQLSDECLALHGKDVLEGEINRRLLEQELKRRGRSVTQKDIDNEITRAADSYGFIKPDRSPDVQGWLKAVTETEHVTIEMYIRDSVWPSAALKQIIGGTIQVTDEDLEKGFQSNYGERVDIQAIVLSNQRQANQVWELARNNPTEQFFGELATQHSIEPVSRSNAGKVPPIRQFGGQPLIEQEAFRLKPGELSGIVSVGDKFVILRCQGRTKPVVTEFAAVEQELRNDIHEKKLRIAMAEEFDRIRESAQIDNFLAGTTQGGKNTVAARATTAVRSDPATPAANVPNTPIPRGASPAKFGSQPAGTKR